MNWSAVAEAIEMRMKRSGESQKQVADRAGVSVSTLRELQRGRSDRQWTSVTLGNVSEGLGWPRGHLYSIARGEIPPDAGWEEKPQGDDDQVVTELRAIREHLARIDQHLDRLSAERP